MVHCGLVPKREQSVLATNGAQPHCQASKALLLKEVAALDFNGP